MILGFTGTRDGMTVKQLETLISWLKKNSYHEVHHGCCVGADQEFISNVDPLEKSPRIVGHPPDNRRLVSQVACDLSTEFCAPLPYLKRNLAIVDACDLLLVGPSGPEKLRSGTWSTVRAARRLGKPIAIFWPDGSVTRENQE